MDSRMRFSEVLASVKQDRDGFRATAPESWLQGRSLFGGLQSAIALRAIRTLLPAELPLRVLQTTFVAPVPAGEVRLSARVLRTGKSVTHAEARILSGSDTAAIVIGVFGSRRPSRVSVIPERPEVVSTQVFDVPFVPGLSADFIQHFALRWIRGDLPFTASRSRQAVLEVALRDEGPMTEEHVLAIADAPPPLAFSHLETFAKGSSMTWTLEMLTDSVSRLPLHGHRLDVELTAAADGYTSQSVMMWGPNGEAVALSRQSMVVFG
jgi:acyl-CoA thioesterase